MLDWHTALRSLPPRMRATVVLFYGEDLSTAQTAAALGCSPATQLRSGCARARRPLSPRCNGTTTRRGLHDAQADLRRTRPSAHASHSLTEAERIPLRLAAAARTPAVEGDRVFAGTRAGDQRRHGRGVHRASQPCDRTLKPAHREPCGRGSRSQLPGRGQQPRCDVVSRRQRLRRRGLRRQCDRLDQSRRRSRGVEAQHRSTRSQSCRHGPATMTGVSCPDPSFCAAVDQSGNVVTSTNPGGGSRRHGR